MKISRSSMIAIGLTLAVVGWMLTGLAGNGSTPAPGDSAANAPRPAMAVTVRQSEAQPVTREIAVSGRTAPNRSIEIAAETEGRVTAISAERGERVSQGDALVSLDLRDRKAREAQAEALVRQRELEFQGAQRLRGREFMSEAQIAEAEAQLESARAELASIRMEIEHTTITAPFDGVMEERSVELGDFVGVGDSIATLVDVDPLIVSGDISEREIRDIEVGGEGDARLLNGEVVSGRIRYVAPVASAATRTFRIELAIPNPQGKLRAGMSAEIVLPSGETLAHRMTPALLTLNDAGEVGVKTVDERNRVQFHPVEIVESDADGIWVTGLPDPARVITVGQGFVAAGETVDPVPASDSLPTREAADK